MATEDLMPKSAALRDALERAKGREPTVTSMLTVAEACEQLRISRWKLNRLRQEKKIKSIKIGSRRLFPASAIAEYVQEQLEAESES